MKKLMQLMVAIAILGPLVLAIAHHVNKKEIAKQVVIHEVEKQLPPVIREIPLVVPPPVVEEAPPAPTFKERVKALPEKIKKLFRRTKPAPTPLPKPRQVIRTPQPEYNAPVAPQEPVIVKRLDCIFPFSLIPGCYVQVF